VLAESDAEGRDGKADEKRLPGLHRVEETALLHADRLGVDCSVGSAAEGRGERPEHVAQQEGVEGFRLHQAEACD